MWFTGLIQIIYIYLISVSVPIQLDSKTNNHSIILPSIKTIMYRVIQIGSTYYETSPYTLGPLTENSAVNILLLIPMGFLAPIIWGKLLE